MNTGMHAQLFLLESGFSDIRDVVRFASPWPWIIAAALALAFILFYWAWKRYQIRQAAIRAAYREPPHQVAERELEALRKEGPSLESEVFSVRVSRVLRHYLEDALSLPAPERTTEEFLNELSDKDSFDDELKEQLSSFLQQSDLVKFARQDLNAEQRSGLLDSALRVIRATVSQKESAEAS